MMILKDAVNCKQVVVFLLRCIESDFMVICLAGYAKSHARTSERKGLNGKMQSGQGFAGFGN